MSYIKDLTLKEMSKMLEDTVKENRAFDMELMEAYEKIRSLENTLAFLKLTKFSADNKKNYDRFLDI